MRGISSKSARTRALTPMRPPDVNCVLRYDNEAGKGDHRHRGEKETLKRWELLRALCGAGPVSIREAARRVGRDVKAVHADIEALLSAMVLARSAAGVEFPYDIVKVEFMLRAA